MSMIVYFLTTIYVVVQFFGSGTEILRAAITEVENEHESKKNAKPHAQDGMG